MLFVLAFLAIATLVISTIAGILTGSFLGFIASVAGGFASAMIFLALSKVLENQNTIMNILSYLQSSDNNARKYTKKTCSRCGRRYDGDMNSCPQCGNRE